MPLYIETAEQGNFDPCFRREPEQRETPRPPWTAQQRLLILDAWRRSGLPARDFALTPFSFSGMRDNAGPHHQRGPAFRQALSPLQGEPEFFLLVILHSPEIAESGPVPGLVVS